MPQHPRRTRAEEEYLGHLAARRIIEWWEKEGSTLYESQRAFARDLGFTFATVNRILKGHRPLPLKKWTRYAAVTGIPLADFLAGGASAMFSPDQWELLQWLGQQTPEDQDLVFDLIRASRARHARPARHRPMDPPEQDDADQPRPPRRRR